MGFKLFCTDSCHCKMSYLPLVHYIVFWFLSGRIPHTEVYRLMCDMSPPVGFGRKCPKFIAYKVSKVVLFCEQSVKIVRRSISHNGVYFSNIYLLSFFPMFIFFATHLPVYQLTKLPAFLLTYPPTYLPTYLLTYVPTYLPTYLPTYFPTHLLHLCVFLYQTVC